MKIHCVGNTTPSTELPRYFCAGIGSLQLGIVLVSRKRIQRTPFQGSRNFSFNLSSRIGPILKSLYYSEKLVQNHNIY